ncbi:MAG: class I SAM-dependent methyltransferase [Nitrosopumilaceae archaeon]
MGCFICSNTNLQLIIDLGKHPPPLNFLTKEQIQNRKERLFSLQLFYCKKCGLCQLGNAVNPALMFKKYTYTSGISVDFRNHLNSLAKTLVKKFQLGLNDFVIDIGSNDGTLLSYFLPHGVKVLGVEPSNIAKLALANRISTINGFFSVPIAKKILQNEGTAKIITATNVFAHVNKLDSFMKGVKMLLDTFGIFVSESQYLLDMIEKLEYDTIYHEHLRYYALKPLMTLFEQYDIEIFDIERIPSHGGSIRVYAGHKGIFSKSNSIKELMKEEESKRLYFLTTLKLFAKRIKENKVALVSLLLDLKRQGKKIVGISAPARSSTILNYCEINSKILDYIVEKGQLKIGKYTPGTHIKVVDDEILIQEQPDYALLLSWHLKDSIVTKIRNDGYDGKIIVPLPQVEII